MHLEGQGRGEQGYAMAALIVGLSVMAILMTVAMPVWKQLAQREKEEELVFRGEQIAHSIGMYQRRTANAFPPNLDVLVQQKFLRKKYKDPITDDDFVPLAQTSQTGQRGAQPGQQGAAQPSRGQQPAGAAAPGGSTAVGGIIGVTSKSTDTSIRLYKGRSHYNEWAFVYTPPTQAPGGPGGVNAPGNQGRGQGRGQGQGNQPTQFPAPAGGFQPRGGPFNPNTPRGNNPRGGPGTVFTPVQPGGRGR